MNRDGKITFAPKGVNGKNRMPKYIWMTAVAAVFFGLLSFLVILAMNDFDLSLAMGKRQQAPDDAQESTTAEAADVSALQDLTHALNFLAVCTGEKELTFCMVVSVVPSEATIRIKPISPDCILETEGGKMRLSDVVQRGIVLGGGGALLGGLEELIESKKGCFGATSKTLGSFNLYIKVQTRFVFGNILAQG